MKKFIRCVAMCLSTIMLVGMLSACGGISTEKYDNYSYGLDENGMYVDIDNYIQELPKFDSWEFTVDQVLEWGVQYMKDSGEEDIRDVNDYIRRFGNEVLASMELANKDSVEVGDIVSATLTFYRNGDAVDGYTDTSKYEVSEDGDEIMTSFIGHKAGDKYETKYTFPENDSDFPGETLDVEVVIESVLMKSPLDHNVVENNLDAFAEILPDVKDTESFLEALRPYIVENVLSMFIESELQSLDIDVPEQFVDYEMYRLKSRISQIGYTYKQYLEAMQMTDSEARGYCAIAAKENYVAMLVFKAFDQTINNDDLKNYYGEALEDVAKIQGEPYLKLDLMREMAIYYVSTQISIEGMPVVEETTTENQNTETDNAVSEDSVIDEHVSDENAE